MPHASPNDERPLQPPQPRAENIVWHEGSLGQGERARLLGRRGATLWLTGLSGSGKSTIAAALEHRLVERGLHAYRLDGDNIRHGLCRDLGFSAEDRAENIRRIGEVAKLFADAGVIALTSFISPYRADRDRVRALHDGAGLVFLEVFVDTPIEVCEARDPKGLYKKARAGQITGFTGIDDPYDPPPAPEVHLRTAYTPVARAVDLCLEALERRGVLRPDAAGAR